MPSYLKRLILCCCMALFVAGSTWGQWACGPIQTDLDGKTPDGGGTDGITRDKVATDTSPGDKGNTDNGNPTDQGMPADSGPQDKGTPDAGKKDEGTPETVGDVITKPAFLQPEGFVNLKLPVKTWTLPAALLKTPIVALEVQSNGNILFGNKLGLYEISGTKTTLMEKGVNVVGIAPWKDGKMVVAAPQAISLWDGSLNATKLHSFLNGANVTTIESRSTSSLWIGTDKSLWLLINDVLREFNQVKGVQWLEYIPGFKVLLIKDGQGKLQALQQAPDGRWLLRVFDNEGIALDQMAAHVEEPVEFWGYSNKTGLFLRKAEQAQAAWWIFRLKPDANEDETIKITDLVYHPKPDTSWAIGGKTLYRLSQKTVGEQPLPAGLGTITYRAGTADGGLWLSDGKKLYRIGSTGPAVSYASDVAPIISASCLGCHAKGKKAAFAPFETYEQVKNKSTVILQRLNKGDMPPRGPLDKAKIDLIQNWVNGGYQK